MAHDTVNPSNILTSKQISKIAPHLLNSANGADEADITHEVHKRKEASELPVDDDSHNVISSTPRISHPRGSDKNSGTGSKNNEKSSWNSKLLNDDEDDDMDIEPDGDDDDDMYLFDISKIFYNCISITIFCTYPTVSHGPGHQLWPGSWL